MSIAASLLATACAPLPAYEPRAARSSLGCMESALADHDLDLSANDAEAQCMLGAALLVVAGVKCDLDEALHWLVRAERQRYEPAFGFLERARAAASPEQMERAYRHADQPLPPQPAQPQDPS